MTHKAVTFRCTIIDFSSEHAPSDTTVAFALAKCFGQSCRVTQVATEEYSGMARVSFGQVFDSRTMRWLVFQNENTSGVSSQKIARPNERLKALAREVGIEADVQRQNVRDILGDLAAGTTEELFIIAQPADPLARQTEPFARVRDAALRAPSAVIFAPAVTSEVGQGILAVCEVGDADILDAAHEIAVATGERVTRIGEADLQTLAEAIQRSNVPYPRAVVMARTNTVDRPTAMSRFAERIGAPVLVLEQPANTP